MMKRLFTMILLLCSLAGIAHAQRITRNFQNVSMSDALKQMQRQTDKYKIVFIYDDLEDFKVTTNIRNKSVPDALRQMIGFYPISMTVNDDNEIYLECTHKTDHRLKGIVVDENNLPLPYASVTLLNPVDSAMVGGGVTNESGYFAIPYEQARVIARITYLGYKPVHRLCARDNLGTIKMQPDQFTLDGVTVKGSKRLTRPTDRGLLANVQGTVLEQFGSVTEMLTHLPLMMGDGTIAGHGTPEIYINNKKVRDKTELDRYRADEILSAEIITNPGPEYGAEVTSVIRLKTVRKAGEGWSGNFSTAYRQGKECYANLNAALNYRTQNGMDFFARGYLTSNNQMITFTADDQLQASSVWDFKKDATYLNRYNYYFADLGWNWEISEKHSVGLIYTANNYITDATSSKETDEQVWRNGHFLEAETNKTVTSLKPRMEHAVNAYYVGEIGTWKLDFSADYYRGHSESDMEGGTIGEKGVNSKTLTQNNLLAEKLVVKAPISKGTLTFGEEVSGVDRKSDFTQNGFSADNSVHQQTMTWALFVNYTFNSTRSKYKGTGAGNAEKSRL